MDRRPEDKEEKDDPPDPDRERDQMEPQVERFKKDEESHLSQ